VTPYGIGHSLGACAWKIECNILNIMYLVAYNHYGELHLDGINIKEFEKHRIDVLITDSIHDLSTNTQSLIVSS